MFETVNAPGFDWNGLFRKFRICKSRILRWNRGFLDGETVGFSPSQTKETSMRIRFQASALVLIAILLGFAQLASAQPAKRRMISLEISADSRAMVGTQQKWMQMLQEVGADKVVSKTARAGTPTVEENELTNSTIIRVTGFIVGNRLKLPGGDFSIRDKTGIRTLLQKLRDDGARVALAEKKAFGLTSEQLVGLHERFAKTVQFSTIGQNTGDVIGKLIRQTGLKFVLDPTAKAAVGGKETVAEELEGMSIGTALAAVVRPLGVVLQPRREQGKSLEIHILDARSSEENWPIGWPIERPPVAAAPDLFEKIPIEIRNFPLNAVLDAIEKKSGVPFFYDHNTFARKGVELSEVKVTLVDKNVGLLVAVSRLLKQSQPRLTYEIRVDENAKPFLWISAK